MKLEEIAAELVAGCRENRTAENLDKLYADHAISVEARDTGSGRECAGLDGIKAKHVWWDQNMEMTGGTVSDPFPHGDGRFAVIFEAQGREKATGNAFEMKEVAVYHVADGKIVREEFFY